MIRILIVEKDLEICKEFINNLNKYVGMLSTFYLASNIREFKAFYNNKETDIILINNNVFNCYKNILEKSRKPYVLFSDINFKEIGEKIIEKNNTFTSIEGKIKRELNYLGYTEYVKPSPKKIIEQILNKILDANTHKGG